MSTYCGTIWLSTGAGRWYQSASVMTVDAKRVMGFRNTLEYWREMYRTVVDVI